MKPPVFDYAAPATVDEAVALLASRGGNAKVIAGGQSLMPMLAFRLAAPELLVDLKRLQGLDRIDIDEHGCGSAQRCAGATSSSGCAAW